VSTPFDLGPPRDDAELARYADLVSQALGPPPAYAREFVDRMKDQVLVLGRVDGQVAGGLGVLRFGHFFGGRSVPAGGITAVAVAPEHRGKGLAGAMTRAALDVCAAQGLVLSTLYPATCPVYRAAGYEIAGQRTFWRFPTASGAAPERTLRMREATAADRPAMKRLYDARARACAGVLDRSAYVWERVLEPIGDKAFAYVVQDKRDLVGYVVFTHKPQPFGYEIVVKDALGATPAAIRRILTFFADHASLAKTWISVMGPGDPFARSARENSREVAEAFPWMARLVDVPGAVAARGFSPALRGEIHLDVTDSVIAKNARRWTLAVDDGRAEVKEGGRGDVHLDVRALAALYTGASTGEELAAAGLAHGDAQALARATSLFAGPAPWMIDFF
jgi:predicted acetyltransferase